MNLDRVHADIEAGRPWKALDRLQGMRRTAPTDQAVLELLGRVRADMGELPDAGLAWFLTDGDDARREDAFVAMRERHGSQAMDTARKLKPLAPIEAFPPGAQARLRDLQGELDRIGVRWDPAARPHEDAIALKQSSPWRDAAGVAGCLGFVALLLVPWLRGLMAFID